MFLDKIAIVEGTFPALDTLLYVLKMSYNCHTMTEMLVFIHILSIKLFILVSIDLFFEQKPHDSQIIIMFYSHNILTKKGKLGIIW